MLTSIVINNFNYGRYVRECIDSALAQSYPNVEVIVVDDGSTDDSREIIASYGDRIVPVFKANGGQASAINVGFARSRGEVVHFLDSDDTVYADAIAGAVDAFARQKVDKVHWQLDVVRENGRPTGNRRPAGAPVGGDLRPFVRTASRIDLNTPPQSGNMWTRSFLAQTMPLDEQIYRTGGGDTYLSMLSLAYGTIASLDGSHGTYRVHGTSHWTSIDFDRRTTLGLDRWTHTCQAVAQLAARAGHSVDLEGWLGNSFFFRVKRVADVIVEHVPEGSTVAVVDGGELALPGVLRQRRVNAFPEIDAQFAGHPSTGEEAIAELARQMTSGVGFLALTWPAFWWLEHYPQLATALQRTPCMVDDDTIKLFDLRSDATTPGDR